MARISCYRRRRRATLVRMAVIPARDLRNHTAEVLRRVERGEEIEVHRDHRPIAKIIPLRGRRRWIPVNELIPQLERLGADDTGLAEELRETLDQSTDEIQW
jgi:prevent-host-death family protein